MKKRILSLVLAFVMVIGMLPVMSMPVYANTVDKNGFSIDVDQGKCKHCSKAHYVKNMKVQSLVINNGNATFTLKVNFNPLSSCYEPCFTETYNEGNAATEYFTYIVTAPFSCDKSF